MTAMMQSRKKTGLLIMNFVFVIKGRDDDLLILNVGKYFVCMETVFGYPA